MHLTGCIGARVGPGDLLIGRSRLILDRTGLHGRVGGTAIDLGFELTNS
jgi:hypothetical protein